MAEGLNDPAVEASDSIRFGRGAPGVERAEVHLRSRGFDPHRHDTYGIGVTTSGVQAFRYRGERRICVPGEWHVLHPDETHDGRAATEGGFGYRILYLAPELIRDALGGGALPFVADPVVRPGPATRLVAPYLDAMDEPVSDLGRAEIAAAAAEALSSLTGGTADERVTIDLPAMERVRDHLAAHAGEQTPAATLEAVAGMDRFAIVRQFRRAFGTTPDRYRTQRRLAMARRAVEAGLPLARVAADCGFADQSHMTRQFHRTYGMTPARWASLTTS
jgi:AraC-like DNA-binding protein